MICECLYMSPGGINQAETSGTMGRRRRFDQSVEDTTLTLPSVKLREERPRAHREDVWFAEPAGRAVLCLSASLATCKHPGCAALPQPGLLEPESRAPSAGVTQTRPPSVRRLSWPQRLGPLVVSSSPGLPPISNTANLFFRALPANVQGLSLIGSLLGHVSITEPITMALRMPSSDWLGGSHMTFLEHGSRVEGKFPKGEWGFCDRHEGYSPLSAGLGSQQEGRSPAHLLS